MKVLLLDADGVVLHKGEYFSERFAREHNVLIDDVVEFFKGPFVECQKGTADLKKELVPYLEKWNWNKGVDAFLQYWFDHDVILHSDIEQVIGNFKAKGMKVYMASNNEKYRADAIRTLLDSKNVLDGSYFSAYLKIRKENPGFFEHILDDLKVSAGDVHFVDNDQKNIDAAASVGIHAHLYNEHIFSELMANL